MAFLRRKLSCFYCGRASDAYWKPGLRSFQCKLCDARNYLDKNGGITDPPISEASGTAPAARYAQLSFDSRSPSPTPISGSSGSIFCHTCTSNQQFVNQALAEYLPSVQDPRYREYEKNLTSYKRQLEARYPQVCSTCEPLVERQIRLAGYTARSDYVRRMNDKSRQGVSKSRLLTRRRSVGVIAGSLWLIVLSAQILWNIAGLLLSEDDDLREISDLTSRSCMAQILNAASLERSCMDLINSWLPFLFTCNVLVIWWNPILLRSSTRARGVGEFYKLQALLLMLRTVELYLVHSHLTLDLDGATLRAIHGTMLMMNLIVTAVSLYTVRPVPQIVRFHKDIEPFEARSTVRSRTEAASDDTSLLKQGREVVDQPVIFPVRRLAVSDLQVQNKVRHEATSSANVYESSDAMEIDTPEDIRKMAGNWASSYRDSPSTGIGARSLSKPEFRPPAPLQTATTRQLRSMTKHSKEGPWRKDSFASNWDLETIASHNNEDDALTVSGDGGSEDALSYGLPQDFTPASARKNKAYRFDDARFHAGQEDTGLEGMLGFFGLKDDPLEAGSNASKNEDTAPGRINIASSSYMPGISVSKPGPGASMANRFRGGHVSIPLLTAPIFIIALGVLALWQPADIERVAEHMQVAGLMWCSAIGILRAVDALNPQRPVWELSNILAFAIETSLGLLLGLLHASESVRKSKATAIATDQDAVSASSGMASLKDPDNYLDTTDDTGANDVLIGSAGGSLPSLTGALLVLVLLQEVVIMYRHLSARSRDGRNESGKDVRAR